MGDGQQAKARMLRPGPGRGGCDVLESVQVQGTVGSAYVGA